MRAHCGLVDESNACRCARGAGRAGTGLVQLGQLDHAMHPTRAPRPPRLAKHVRDVDQLQRVVAVFRNHPDYAAPSLLHDDR